MKNKADQAENCKNEVMSLVVMNYSISAAEFLLGDDDGDEGKGGIALDGANLKDLDMGCNMSSDKNHKVKQVSMAIGKLAGSQETAGKNLLQKLTSLEMQLETISQMTKTSMN